MLPERGLKHVASVRGRPRSAMAFNLWMLDIMETRAQSLLIVCLLLFTVAVILIWQAMNREQQLSVHRYAIQESIAESASRSIASLVREQQDRLHIFADEYAPTLLALVQNPDQDALRSGLEKRMRKRFPSYMALTIATPRGEPLLEDIESFVGDLCKTDLQRYSMDTRNLGHEQRNRVYIHPRADHYHYDIMALWDAQTSGNGIFFVSFDPANIAAILEHLQIPGLSLVVVKRSDPSLIEISAGGARDKLGRKYNLSAEEQRQISVSRDIEGTDWVLVAIEEKAYVARQEREIWIQALSILALVVLATILMMLIVWRSGRCPE